MKVFMKKGLIAAILVVMLLSATAFSVVADTGIVSLADEKPAPALFFTKPSGAADSYIEGDDIERIALHEYELKIWSYAERETAPESVRNELWYAYSVLRGVSSLGELESQLDAKAQEIDGSYSAAAFVVSDLLDFTLTAGKMAILQSGDERILYVTLQYDAQAVGHSPVIIQYNPGDKTWSLADMVYWSGSDRVSVRLSEPGPIAFLTVDGGRMEHREVTGGEKYIWIAVIAVLIAIFTVVTVFVVFYRRGHGKARPADGGQETCAAPPPET